MIDHGDQRVVQRMHPDDDELLLPLGTCGSDVVGADDLQHRGTRHARHLGDRLGRQRDGRQDRGLEGAEPGGGQPAQVHREEQNEQQAQPEDRHGQADHGEDHGDGVEE